ncbi:MAG TPA: Mpo1-like protein, partial [bacterium]|nr:Mpo1-like protein [bacterium]
MKTLTQQLANYAAYHRDRRNIATHFVGIPVIVISVAALLSRPALPVGGLPLSPAVLVTACTVAYYFALDVRYGLVMLVAMAGSVVAGAWLAAMSTTMWLGSSIGLFVGGWIVQFVGHVFEGRKPA